MIEVGMPAPSFSLPDPPSRAITLEQVRNRRHVMLLFYPLDLTPWCGVEVPGVEALLGSLLAADPPEDSGRIGGDEPRSRARELGGSESWRQQQRRAVRGRSS